MTGKTYLPETLQSCGDYENPRHDPRVFRRINLRISEETLPNKNSLKLEVYCQMMTQAGFRLHGDGRRKGGNDELRESGFTYFTSKTNVSFLTCKAHTRANSLLIVPL